MTSKMRGLPLALLLAGFAGPSFGHAGHLHEARGTIKEVSADAVTLTIAYGKELAFVRTAETQCLRAAKPADCSTMTVSERAIVFYADEPGAKKAVKIELGAKPSGAPAPRT
jgi:hypothetical protein